MRFKRREPPAVAIEPACPFLKRTRGEHDHVVHIACVGAGPGGLTFALFAAKHGHRVDVLERRRSGVDGLGVVLWPDHLRALRDRDARLVDDLLAHSREWNDQLVSTPSREPAVLPGRGHGIARASLLSILQSHAEAAGVTIHREHEVRETDELDAYDLVVAADGASSTVRQAHAAQFGTHVAVDRNRYAWFELDRPTELFAFPFVRAVCGWCWGHVYPFAESKTTFIVETTEEAWRAEGFDRMPEEDTTERLEQLFHDHLLGGRLQPVPGSISGNLWLQFRLVENRHLVAGRTALIGDAAHTTHFSTGSGTKLALEDATALIDALSGGRRLKDALAIYDRARVDALRDSQRSARLSTRFFEHLPQYIERPSRDFARLVERRRSKLLPLLPPRAFLAASRTADRLRGIQLPY